MNIYQQCFGIEETHLKRLKRDSILSGLAYLFVVFQSQFVCKFSREIAITYKVVYGIKIFGKVCRYWQQFLLMIYKISMCVLL